MPLVVLTILFGVYPKPVLDMSAASVRSSSTITATRVDRRQAAALCRARSTDEDRAMSFESAGYQLLPVLPELVLAVGAMALLMLGAYRGERATGLLPALRSVCWCWPACWS